MREISILVADDDREIADLIAIHLKKEGFHVITVSNGRETLQVVEEQLIDLLILDIMMPEMDGYEVTHRIREKYHMLLSFLSAKTSDFDKVQGLVIGADDYMTKPFVPIELVARVNAQLRRSMKFNQSHALNEDHTRLEYSGLVISLDQRLVTLYDKTIELTPKEFDILYLLASHPKKVFSTEAIFNKVWGEVYFEGANTVMVHIRTLRKKLKEDRQKDKWIKTVWGVGYAFNG